MSSTTYNTVEAPRSRIEEKAMIEQAIAASLGEPVDEQALLIARRQAAAAVRPSPQHQQPSPSHYRSHLVAMKRPNGVYC